MPFRLQSTSQYFMDWVQLESEPRIFNTETKRCIKLRGGDSGERIEPMKKAINGNCHHIICTNIGRNGTLTRRYNDSIVC